MNKKRLTGLLISLAGLALMGYTAGVNEKTGSVDDRNLWIGLGIVLIGLFIVTITDKGKAD